MEEKLDEDFNPIWLCKAAGLLFPSLILLAFVVWAAVHRGRNPADWTLIAWSSLLLVAFWLRYRSGRVASLGREFTFGLFLGSGSMLILPAAHHDRGWWSMVAFVGFTFIASSIQYFRHFYFRPQGKGGQHSEIHASC